MADALQRLRAAEIDGRAQNGRYIQKQLRNLHDALTSNVSAIQAAMRSDSHYSAAETEVEYHLALDCVRQHYDNIDFDKEVQDEYAIARGEDAPLRRIAAGTVHISPNPHTLLYSAISPLSAAIASGNCTAVELENSLLELPRLLRSLLSKALDRDTVAILDSRPKDSTFLSKCVRVYGAGSDSEPLPTTLTSPSKARTIAFVDRSADVNAAAAAIVSARASFGGKSPYAPDVVLVNEFRMKDFTDAAVSHFTKFLSAPAVINGAANANGHAAKPKRGDSHDVLSREERAEQGTSVILSGDHGTLVTVSDRKSKLVTKKFAQPILVVHPISSLDDAIDFANNGDTLLAAYLFANLATAKYLAQFVPAHASYTNHIPPALLVGPAAPLHHPTATHPRYDPALFTVPRPAHATAPASSAKLHAALTSGPAAGLRAESVAPLKPDGQRAGKIVGFFDQGLITGVVVFVLPVVAGLGTLGFLGVRMGVRKMLR